MNVKYCISLFVVMLFASCSSTQLKHDAAGIFEADEVIVSSELSGKLIQFNIKEGA